MTTDVDVAILGAGCAGLSLAVALAQRAPALRVQLFESRANYRRDRTWCFWNTTRHSFNKNVTQSWHSWRVRQGGAEVRQHSNLYSYQHLPADRFYDAAINRSQRAGHILRMETTVSSVRQTEDACDIETNHGVLRARWVFDSRPHASNKANPMLLQRFLGWHIRCEVPCFDPSVVDLMDFQPYTERGRIAFVYVLPFSATEALVEATFLDDPRLTSADTETMLRDYLGRLCKREYEVIYREAASLGMGEWSRRPQAQGRVFDIGTRGGRLKASSGYAFQRIQRQSLALARALAMNAPLPLHVEPPAYKLLDRIFLQALLRHPERTADYFLNLFRRVPPVVLVRFLSETASAREVLQVMLALPKLDFVTAALSPAMKGRLE